MMFLVFVVVLSILLGGTDAVQGNEIPTLSEINRIQEFSNCGDTVLSKLVHELEDMREKIMYEIQKQLAKQVEVINKMDNDFAQVKGIVEKQSVDIEEIKKSVKSESCHNDMSKLEASVDALTNKNRLISESLQSHNERLRVHDQRLQNITTKGCSSGWGYLPGAGGFFKVIFKRTTWEQAHEECKAAMPGAHLAAITSGNKKEAIKQFLQEEFLYTGSNVCVVAHPWFKGMPAVWTSGQTEDPNRCGTPYMWKTKDGVQIPFQYTAWIPGRFPDCANNGENCVQLVGGYNYLWNDAPCSDVYCALCEFPSNY